MTEADKIVKALLEVEGDEENLADLLGADYAQTEPNPQGLPASVEVHDRWKDVTIGDVHFCISYLTPVAVSLPGRGVVITDKQWGSSTSNHIRKWYNSVFTPPEPVGYPDIRARCEKMPQNELVELFKQYSKKALWTDKQSRAIDRLPSQVGGLRSGTAERVSVKPHQPE